MEPPVSAALTAAALIVATGAAHSVLGERYILTRLFRRREALPKLLGGTAFTAGTLRFAWHLTTVAWWAMAWLVASAATAPPSAASVLHAIGTKCPVSAVFPLVLTCGRHLSWLVFLLTAGLLFWSARALPG